MPTRVSFIITDDRAMNTDVISQPINEELPDGTCYLGEIIVNQDRVRHQAKEYGVSEDEEMARVVAHGVLHLLGYTDKEDRDRGVMKSIEDSIVSKIRSAKP